MSNRCTHAVFLALDNEEPIGCAIASVSGDLKGWISDVYVKQKYRGKKLSNELCRQAQNWLTENEWINSQNQI